MMSDATSCTWKGMIPVPPRFCGHTNICSNLMRRSWGWRNPWALSDASSNSTFRPCIPLSPSDATIAARAPPKVPKRGGGGAHGALIRNSAGMADAEADGQDGGGGRRRMGRSSRLATGKRAEAG